MSKTILMLISHLKDWLHQGLEILSEFQQAVESTPQPIQETPEAEFLSKGSQVLARVFKGKGEIQIFPIESLKVKADDRAIIWLKGRFKAAKDKHPDFNFEFFSKDGILEKITVSGNLSEFERLRDATVWALEKASSR
ncbi:hypothetical protein DRO19_04595 [Candidatus Bathyarchaeota archaeon]|nr:MAG: hypothetical protein DRO19_04595 [Candidatus Bathyarchaeota archaeon]